MTIEATPTVGQPQLTAFGEQVLAPVFATFALLLLREAQAKGISHLAFVARDGLFLRQVTETLIQALTWDDAPHLGEIYLSRLSTSLAGRKHLDEFAFAEAQSVKGGVFTLESLLRYYGLEGESVVPACTPLGFDLDTPLSSFTEVAPLLQNPDFCELVQQACQQKQALLKRYLMEQGLFSAPNAALVDIGWRGTLVATLDRAFSRNPDYHPLHCFYLGYWHELGCLPLAKGRITGLLSDQHRGQGLKEGAAYYLSLMLEAICRPVQGPTMGYTLANDNVVPISAPHAPSAMETTAHAQSAVIRQGILTGVAALGESWRKAPPHSETLRQQTQGLLRRLAFFPSTTAITLAQTLCHTEGHHRHWVTPLLPAKPPRPWREPRTWLAGLSAPWRSGYVAASGGPLMAGLFYGMEAALQTLPAGVRRGLRTLALNAAKQNP